MVLKIILTLWTAILIPVYAHYYGFQNFLWFSDIGLFGTVIALWLESRLLLNIITLAALPAELAWSIDFFVRLISGASITGASNYMFDPQYPLFLRGLSLFHLIIPIVWLWYIYKKGYTRQAFAYAIVLSWSVLLATYFFTDPAANINSVFSVQNYNWAWISPLGWLLVLLVISALTCFVQHKLFLKLAKERNLEQ